MGKRFVPAFLSILILALFSSCQNPEPSQLETPPLMELRFDYAVGISHTYVYPDTMVQTPMAYKKTGYKFLGWKYDDKFISINQKTFQLPYSASGYDLYAVYEPIAMNIIFYDGSEEVLNTKIYNKSLFDVPQKESTDNYTFVGWEDYNYPYTFIPADSETFSLPYNNKGYEYHAVWSSESIGIDEDGGVFAKNKDITSLEIKEKFNGSYASYIKQQGFRDCTQLSDVSIPKCITRILDYAFMGCTNLNKLEIIDFDTDHQTKYIGTDIIKDCENAIVTLCQAISYDFKSNPTLFNSLVIIPAAKYNVANYFYAVRAKEIILAEGFVNIGLMAFSMDSVSKITIPESVTGISSKAFLGCSSLQEINPLENVMYVSSEAFSGCYSLEKIQFGNKLYSIGEKAFAHCKSLKTVELGNSIKQIEKQAFINCKSLTEISIPSSITFIAPDAFSNCTSLTRIYIDKVDDGSLLDAPWGAPNASVYWKGEF